MRSRPAFVLYFLHAIASVKGQKREQYDYVICGGGTTGLAVAHGLSENRNINVLVVEAGGDGSVDQWGYNSVPQEYANGRVQYLPAGKGVGGSSQINGRVYSRPESTSIDNWGEVNNADWSWENLFPYFKASESLAIPSGQSQQGGNTFNPDYHGFNGHVNVTYPNVGTPQFLDILDQTASAFDIPHITDFNGGHARGLANYPATVRIPTSREMQRESSREAFWLPDEDRTNLELLSGTSCLNIVWSRSAGNSNAVVASGVRVSNAHGETTIKVTGEVILSAGVYRSPTILELSGIGQKALLAANNIDLVVDLPGVGENLQDQAQGNIVFQRSSDSSLEFPTPTDGEITTNYLMHLTYTDIFGDDAPDVQKRTNASLTDFAQTISTRIAGVLSAEQILASLQVQYDNIFNRDVPVVEIFSTQAQNNTHVNFEFWPLLPFNRGNVHISGANADVTGPTPVVDPNWFITDWDWEIYIGSARWLRRLFRTKPLSGLVDSETYPGRNELPIDAGDEDMRKFWSDHFRAGWHGVGSAAMLPREWGGVVDSQFKVYGTGNVRVIDASAIPFIIGGHPTSILYAMAGRAVDIILGASS